MPTKSNALDATLSLRLSDLRSSAARSSTNIMLTGSAKWFELHSDKEGEEGKTIDGMDSAEFVQAFDRNAINKAYITAVQPTSDSELSPYGDAQAAKVQLDVMAALERDMRMRTRSRVRMMAHGVARLTSHGLDDGPINRCIVNYMKLLLERRA